MHLLKTGLIKAFAILAGITALMVSYPVAIQAAPIPGITIDGTAIDDGTHVFTGGLLGYPTDPLGGTTGGIITNLTLGGIPGPAASIIVIAGNIPGYSVLGGGHADIPAPYPYPGVYGQPSGNTVTVQSGGVVGTAGTGSVVGGFSLVFGDTVEINNVYIHGTVNKEVFGAWIAADQGLAQYNHVYIYDGATVNGQVFGGNICAYAGTGCADINNGTVINNNITIEGGTVQGIVVGGRIGQSTGTVTTSLIQNNIVTINSGIFNEYIAGGELTLSNSSAYITGSVINNKVIINNGTVNTGIRGGFGADNAIVNNNTVEIFNGTINLVYGGILDSATGSVTENKVYIHGGNITSNVLGGANHKGGHAERNIVEINNAIIGGIVHGGISAVLNTSTSKANNNTVKVNNSTVGSVIGGQSDYGIVNENLVEVSNSTVNGNIVGGIGTVASRNTVKLNNNTITGAVHGATSGSDNTVIFQGGTNIVSGQVGAHGDIAIQDGNNTFSSLVTTAATGRLIDITGGTSVFQLGLESAGGNISVRNATVSFKNSTVTAANLTFGDGGVLNVGQDTVTFATDATFNDGSVIEVSTDGSVDGQIVATGQTLTFNDDVLVKLDVTNVASDYWSGKRIAVADTITGADSIDGLLYLISSIQDAGQYYLVAEKILSISEFLTNLSISKNKPIADTPNLVKVLGLMDTIRNHNPVLDSDLRSAIVEILDLPASQVQTALGQLIGEPAVNISSAVASTALKTQSVVLGRLDRIREADINSGTPPAAGSGDELNRIWVGGFGVWSDADNQNYVFGYDYKAGGISLGYDRKIDAVPGLRLGISAAFSKGDIDNNDGLTNVDVETSSVGIYGSYTLSNNVFFDATVAYGNAQNDYDTRLLIGGKKHGAFDVDTWQFGLRGGAVIQTGGFQFVPSAGVRVYTFKQDDWQESLSGAAVGRTRANRFSSSSETQVDIPIQLKINTSLQAGSATITPEVRLGYTFVAKRPEYGLRVGFVGDNSLSVPIHGVKSSRNTFQAGAGVKINTGSVVDAYVNYDFQGASHFKSHNVSVGLGFEF
jgi:uncharacterized protein with beta-barrel porin domain